MRGKGGDMRGNVVIVRCLLIDCLIGGCTSSRTISKLYPFVWVNSNSSCPEISK